MQSAREGYAGGVRFLYLRYERAVDRCVRALVGDAHAEAVTRAVFARLGQALSSYDERQPLGDWILLCARNTALEWIGEPAEQPGAGDSLAIA